ncbi:MAG: UTP--glucose-1-phosphate uridylyltransferase, partial [Bacteroidetes bacterium]|nr:UTP--glucose-1-phosphate uridylyltransferase [Bacteroidota bacterium]
EIPQTGHLAPEGFDDLLTRKFEQAVARFRAQAKIEGLNGNLASGLAEAYHHLTFQILADQVRKSVRSSLGNRWMFRGGHIDEHPIAIHPRLLQMEDGGFLYPILSEATPVRMDLSHSGWSDIFFLGMDYPEGARVINVSVDLGVFGRDDKVVPPIHAHFRVINEPVIRLTSIDLKVAKDISDLDDLFNFGNDYLSLLKAGIIASGFIPPSFEETHQPLSMILDKIVGKGLGIELVTKVNEIPKGSRFAVSTNLLSGIIAVMMRATRQTQSLEGPLTESEKRTVASRAILGEWIGGSGGGWQDSGGVWPGIKIIEGAYAEEGDPEFGISRGCLLPLHRVLDIQSDPKIEEALTSSLLLMHGGMAQNVGPILEMVTEKYLLRAEDEWKARLKAHDIFNEIVNAVQKGDMNRLGQYTSENFNYPIKTIIPWASNYFTETVIAKAKSRFGKDYLGFLMLGGMSGGGMGMFVKPENYQNRKIGLLEILSETKKELSTRMPFAIEPVVYNFSLNHNGTSAKLLTGRGAMMPDQYYQLQVSELVNADSEQIPYIRRAEYEIYSASVRGKDISYDLLRTMISNLLKVSDASLQEGQDKSEEIVENIKNTHGFDQIQHETLRKDLIRGRIGLARNRLPVESLVEDVEPEDVKLLSECDNFISTGEDAIKGGKIAVLSLAGGVGSRWTKGAGVIKALNPFTVLGGKHRSFLEIHLCKTAQVAKKYEVDIPHIVATSYLTQDAIREELLQTQSYNYSGSTYLSPGKSIGQRFIPMERDLRFLWEETQQEILDENKQKVLESVREALIGWAKNNGEGNDYTDNLPHQRLNPLGHWYEVSNLLRNGVMKRLLKENPQVDTIMLHNIDTLGADIDPRALGYHLNSGNMLTFEVVPRRIDDRGGGLARVNGQVRLLEGLAQPHEEDELKLSYYNSMTTWIQVDDLLNWFDMTREDLEKDPEFIDEKIRNQAKRMPTYVTIKEVKYRWGHGQEDIYPVAQVEKLWGDMSAIPDVSSGYLVVPRMRGQQLKDPAQLDAWMNDGSRDYIAELCGW